MTIKPIQNVFAAKQQANETKLNAHTLHCEQRATMPTLANLAFS